MLTRTGWGVILGAMATLIAGRLLGIHELFLLGAGASALVIGAFVWVNATRLRLDVSRDLHPPRVYAGSASRVDLRLRNRGRRRTPPLTLRDPVGRTRGAEIAVGPLEPGEEVRSAYRLPARTRGIVPVGPLAVELTDPFGLVTVATEGAERAELTVYPAVEHVEPLPHTLGDDPHAGADHPNALSSEGEDFYALRHYELGDDLRRVHWRATARHDDLMVRQEEMPWQGRATVVLDSRRGAHTDDSFEQAVSAAASIVVACQKRRFLMRLVTSDGRDTGFAAGQAHVEAIMERLATVQVSRQARLQGVVGALRRTTYGGALVALLGGRAEAGGDAVLRLTAQFPHATMVVFAPAGGVPAGALAVGRGQSFAEVWNPRMHAGRPSGARTRA